MSEEPLWKESKEAREAEERKQVPAERVDEDFAETTAKIHEQLAADREKMLAALPQQPAVDEDAGQQPDEEERRRYERVEYSDRMFTGGAPAPITLPKVDAEPAPRVNREQMVPLDDKITVVLFAERTHTEGGIEIPESSRERPRFGTVLAAARVQRIKAGLRGVRFGKGDVVCFSRYAGQEINTDSGLVVILRRDEVLAVVKRRRRFWLF